METAIDAAIQIAFEAGRWLGQVDLEEHYDCQQYSSVLMESLVSRKTAMPAHPANTRPSVQVTLRSDEWREGVKNQVSLILQQAKQLAATPNNACTPTNGAGLQVETISTPAIRG